MSPLHRTLTHAVEVATAAATALQALARLIAAHHEFTLEELLEIDAVIERIYAAEVPGLFKDCERLT